MITIGKTQSLSMWVNPRKWYYFYEGHHFVFTLVSMAHYFRRAGLKAEVLPAVSRAE